MNRWITQAVVFGVAVSEAAAGPLHPSPAPSLSIEPVPDGSDGVVHLASFEYLNQCAEANLVMDSCLVSKTFLAVYDMDGPSTDDDDDDDDVLPVGTGDDFDDDDFDDDDFDDDDLPVRRRFLDEHCSAMNSHVLDSLNLTMVSVEEECAASDHIISDLEFDSAATGFLKVFNSTSCFQELCEGTASQTALFLEILWGELAECAGVDLDINQCLMDQLFSSTDNHVERVRRKLSDSSSGDSSACEQPSYEDVSWMVAAAGSQCSSVTSQELATATSDLAAIFASTHCLGSFGCEEDTIENPQNDDNENGDQDDDSADQDNDSANEGLDYFNIAIKYIETCSGEDLNTTSCLASTTTDTFAAWGTAPSGTPPTPQRSASAPPTSSPTGAGGLDVYYPDYDQSWAVSGCINNAPLPSGRPTYSTMLECCENAYSGQVSGACLAGLPSPPGNNRHRQRFLQASDGACAPPDLEEPAMRYILEQSKQQCMDGGHVISDQEFEQTVDDFMGFFGAQTCWVSLCEEESAPTEMMLQIMFDEIAQCAGAEIDFNPCLLDQIFHIVFFSGEAGATFDTDAARRKLEETLGSSGAQLDDPCADQASSAEIQFAIGLLLAGAEERCLEMDEVLGEGDVAHAESELLKLFGAHHCWGVSQDCNGNNEDHSERHSSYLAFMEESTTWMLGQCGEEEANSEITCVFARSVEVMHGMNRFGWSHDGHSDSIAQASASSICTPPAEEFDIERIAYYAMDYCAAAGSPVLPFHFNQAIDDLRNLTESPDCWEDLCEPEVQEWIAEEWMHTCASVDLKFLTAHGSYTEGDVSLDSDRLRCMADYIASQTLELDAHEHWSCSLPRLGQGVCGSNPTDHGIGNEAYFYCGGETPPPSPLPSTSVHPTMHPTAHPTVHPTAHPTSRTSTYPSTYPTIRPSKSPSMHPTTKPSLQLSMSFAYDDDYDWTPYDPDMSLSMSLGLNYLDDGFSLSSQDPSLASRRLVHDDDDGDVVHSDDWNDGNEERSELSLYIEVVCGLIDEVNANDVAQDCLQPVCDIGLEDLFGDHTVAPSNSPTPINHSVMPSSSPIFRFDDDAFSMPYNDDGFSMPYDTMPSEMPVAMPLFFDDDAFSMPYDDDHTMPSEVPAPVPTGKPTVQPAMKQTVMPTVPPSSSGSPVHSTPSPSGSTPVAPGPLAPTKAPITPKPTPFPTRQPTSSPTIQQFGSVEVSFEVGVTLEGIEMSELDLTTLGAVVDLLESVFGHLLPPGAIVRLLKLGGIPVGRRVLRFLQDIEGAASGVDVEFEVVMTQTCSSAKCDDAEADQLSTAIYEDITSNIKAKVESGELTTSIQQEAESLGVSELSDVSVSPSSLQVSEARVTVKEAQDPADPPDDDAPDDDDIASSRVGQGVAISIIAGFVSTITLLLI